MPSFAFTVEVEVERTEGKFASNDELAEQIQEALDSANPDSLEGSNEGQYEVTSWEVTLVEKSKPAKQIKVKVDQTRTFDKPAPTTPRPVPANGRVTVVWRDSPTATSLGVLVYTPEGTIRTYRDGAVDPRITIDGRADTKEQAIEFLRAGDGKHLLVPVAVAKQLGDTSWDFDEG